MGVELVTYRSCIGVFNTSSNYVCNKSSKDCKSNNSREAAKLIAVCGIIVILLLISGIETNPGPGYAFQKSPELHQLKSTKRALEVNFAVESERLASFFSYLSSFPKDFSISRLAQSGFFAESSNPTAYDTSVEAYQIKCYFCGFTWTPQRTTDKQEDPIVQHRRANPECVLLQGKAVENISFKPTTDVKDYTSSFSSVYEQPNGLRNAAGPEDSGIGASLDDDMLQLPLRADVLGELKELSETFAQLPKINSEQTSSINYSSPVASGNFLLGNSTMQPSLLVTSANFSNAVQTNTSSLSNHSTIPDRPPIAFNDYRLEICRLQTFKQPTWPENHPIDVGDLANSGFYALGDQDRVQCAFCKGILRNWRSGDRPLIEHMRHFPECIFLNSSGDSGNVPIGEETQSMFGAISMRTDENRQETNISESTSGIVTNSPSNTNYALPSERTATFVHFPRSVQQNTDDLMKAGFYYSNDRDFVICFFCSCRVGNWQRGHDPWVRHAQESPHCGFVKLNKGENFISAAMSVTAAEGRFGARKKRPKVRNHNISEAQVDKLLEDDTVSAVIALGCEPEIVRKVVRRRIRELGHMFPNPDSLMEECYDYVSSESEDEGDKKQQCQFASRKADGKASEGNSTKYSEVFYEQPKDEESLIAETAQLKNERTCKICLDAVACIVFLKCGHLVCCSSCAPAMRHCPICRKPILGTIKVDNEDI